MYSTTEVTTGNTMNKALGIKFNDGGSIQTRYVQTTSNLSHSDKTVIKQKNSDSSNWVVIKEFDSSAP